MLLQACILNAALSNTPDALQANIRKLELPPNASIHKQTVYGQPNLSTAIRLPEDFTEIECAFCRELKPEEFHGKSRAEAAAEEMQSAIANGKLPSFYWYYTQVPAAKTIYVRPRQPGRVRRSDPFEPFSAFATAVHVPLKSGDHLILNLQLADVQNEQSPDAVVDFVFPGKEPLRGKMAELETKLRQECRETQRTQGAQELATALLTVDPRDSASPLCRTFVSVPHRKDGLYVRLGWGCVTDTIQKLAMISYSLHNDGDLAIIESANLTPVGGEPLTTSSSFAKTTLIHDAVTSGVAIAVLKPGAPLPSKWQLTVNERGGRQRQVVVSNIAFD